MDIVFPSAMVVCNLNGCYWHGCDRHYRPSTKNASFWSSKVRDNQARDAETDALLVAGGWVAIRVWEHEDVVEAANRVEQVVRERRLALNR